MHTLNNKEEFSIVIPVYNSEECLEELADQVHTVFSKLHRSYKIYLVNDHSIDNSWNIIRRLSATNPNIIGICLRKNFGQDNALMAGMEQAKGDFIIIMDDDLQHDPAYIPDLINEISKGYDVVYANYATKKQKLWKNMGSWFNDKVANILLKKPKNIYLSPYKVIASPVVKEVIKYQGAYPYVDGLLFRVTSNFSQIYIEHKKRYLGESNYTFWRSIKIWSHLATNFSVIPLRVATFLGLSCACIGLFFSLFFIIEKIIHPENPIGWASTIVSILLFGGIQLLAIGIMGEYIGKTYLNINKQPQFVIKEIVLQSSQAAKNDSEKWDSG